MNERTPTGQSRPKNNQFDRKSPFWGEWVMGRGVVRVVSKMSCQQQTCYYVEARTQNTDPR